MLSVKRKLNLGSAAPYRFVRDIVRLRIVFNMRCATTTSSYDMQFMFEGLYIRGLKRVREVDKGREGVRFRD
jgi:hypothetical protein